MRGGEHDDEEEVVEIGRNGDEKTSRRITKWAGRRKVAKNSEWKTQ